MHDVCSFSHCQRSVEQKQVSVSILDLLVWNSALPQVGRAPRNRCRNRKMMTFVKIHVSLSAMAGWWLCSVTCISVYTVVANGTVHSGPSAAHAEGSASATRACQSAHRRVRPIGGTISRRLRNLQLRLRRHSAIGTLGNNCGQMVPDAGQVRASTRCFCRCIWLHQVPLGGRRASARVVVGDARARLASRVSGSFVVTCRCRSFCSTHKHD